MKICQKLCLDILIHLWKFHQNPLRNKRLMANLLFLKICVSYTTENLQKLCLDILMHLWKFHQIPLRNKRVMAILLFLKICIAYTAENLSTVVFGHSNASVKILWKSVEKSVSNGQFTVPENLCSIHGWKFVKSCVWTF